MADWQPIETAPKNEGNIKIKTKGEHELDVFWVDCLLDYDENDCGGWVSAVDGEEPDCWTDGVCWEINEDGLPSDPPVAWRRAE